MVSVVVLNLSAISGIAGNIVNVANGDKYPDMALIVKHIILVLYENRSNLLTGGVC